MKVAQSLMVKKQLVNEKSIKVWLYSYFVILQTRTIFKLDKYC